MTPVCQNCQRGAVYAKGRCYTCWRYRRRHGSERPEQLHGKILGRHHRVKPKGCKVCGDPLVVSNLRCNACRVWHERHGTNRPRYLWDKNATCATCGIPLATVDRTVKGYCDPCYHFVKRKKVRPRELWGMGEFGWCACGRPATVQRQGAGCCRLHAAG